MDANPKARCRLGRGDIEVERVVEDVLVTIRRDVGQEEVVPLPDRYPAQDAVSVAVRMTLHRVVQRIIWSVRAAVGRVVLEPVQLAGSSIRARRPPAMWRWWCRARPWR